MSDLENTTNYVEAILSDPRLTRVAPQLAQMTRHSIRIRATLVEENELPVSVSKLGGSPDLPLDMAWPTGKLYVPTPSAGFIATYPGKPILPADGIISLPFIAQLRMEELAAYDRENLLPKSGILYFFYNNILYYSDTGDLIGIIDNLTGYSFNVYDYDSPANRRVLFYDGDFSQLRRTSAPGSIPEQVRYKPCTLSFNGEETLPNVETCFIGRQGSEAGKLLLTEEEWGVYVELCSEIRANERIHQMLGHSNDVQPYAMEGSYLYIRDEIFPDLPDYETLLVEEQQRELEQGRLLLQIDEELNGMRFGRSGRLYFFLREQDLAARNFSQVWALEQ